MKKLSSFVAGLLLVPVLAFASPFSSETDASGLSPPQVTPVCYVYYMGRWIIIPC